MGRKKADLLQGTLQLLILKTLSLEPMHGLGITRRLQQITGGSFAVSLGSMFPALHRMESQGLVDAEWGESENGRRAKFYRLTRLGRKQLKEERRNWERTAAAVQRILRTV